MSSLDLPIEGPRLSHSNEVFRLRVISLADAFEENMLFLNVRAASEKFCHQSGVAYRLKVAIDDVVANNAL